MNTHIHTLWLTTMCLAVIAFGDAAEAQTITLSVEPDKPVLSAESSQPVYLRIGLTGCPLEKLRERPPVNVALVIDKSGSMSGQRIHHAREAAILALRRLNENDIVSVVVFDSSVRTLVPATKMTRRNEIIRAIRQIEAGGTTALYAGVLAGAHEVEKFQSPGRVNRVVLLSDGHANVGPQSPKALGQLGAQLAAKGLSITTIGLGLGYNEDLMSLLAFKSDGGHYFAESPNELASVFEREFDRALSVVAQDVRIEIICGENFRPVRILGREGEIQGRSILIDVGSVYSEHEKYVLVEMKPAVKNAVEHGELANVRLRYQDMNSKKTVRLEGIGTDVRFSASPAEVEKHLNKRVAADVVEQIAIEQNERATALRDEGHVEQARQVLIENSAFLRSNAARLGSKPLEEYSEENAQAADQLNAADWTRQRKVMRESQNARRTQQ